MTDVHTHTFFSCDGKADIADMTATAKNLGMRFYGVSEHFDYDCRKYKIKFDDVTHDYVDEPAYFARGRELQKEVNDQRFTLLIGAECGFDPDEAVKREYAEMIEQYSPDFVVNSIHTLNGKDCYFVSSFDGYTKKEMFKRYLDRVRLSLDAPYPYDVVGHIGYVCRNAPYPDPVLHYEEFPDELDDIFRTIIKKGKILEANTNVKTAGSPFLPYAELFARYYELGGRLVSFCSDAHQCARIGENWQQVKEAWQKIGFTHITVPNRGEYISVPLDEQ